MFRNIPIIAITAIVFGNVVSQQRKAASSSINETMLKAHIKFLADDMLEGRGTGARGGELAANVLGPTNDFIPLGAERSSLKAVVDAVARDMGLRVSPGDEFAKQPTQN